MAALNDKQKRFIVERLAMYETQLEVIAAVKAEYGIELTKSQVSGYNAAEPWARKRMSKDLADHFDQIRADYCERTANIAIAQKAWRLRKLEEIARAAKSPPIIMAALEQAAKDVGDAYTNRKDITSDGQPIKAVIGVELDEV